MKTHWMSCVLLVALAALGCQSPSFNSPFAHKDNPVLRSPLTRLFGKRSGGVPKNVQSKTEQVATAEDTSNVKRLLSQGDAAFQKAASLERQHRQADAERLYAQARSYYLKVLQKAPNNASAHHRLAIIADKQGDYQTAEKHYLAALKTAPNDPNLLNDLGYSYLLRGRYADSERYLQAALKQSPTHPQALNNLGLLYTKRGEYDRALAVFRRTGSEAEARRKLAQLLPQGLSVEQALAKSKQSVPTNNNLLAANSASATQKAWPNTGWPTTPNSPQPGFNNQNRPVGMAGTTTGVGTSTAAPTPAAKSVTPQTLQLKAMMDAARQQSLAGRTTPPSPSSNSFGTVAAANGSSSLSSRTARPQPFPSSSAFGRQTVQPAATPNTSSRNLAGLNFGSQPTAAPSAAASAARLANTGSNSLPQVAGVTPSTLSNNVQTPNMQRPSQALTSPTGPAGAFHSNVSTAQVGNNVPAVAQPSPNALGVGAASAPAFQTANSRLNSNVNIASLNGSPASAAAPSSNGLAKAGIPAGVSNLSRFPQNVQNAPATFPEANRFNSAGKVVPSSFNTVLNNVNRSSVGANAGKAVSPLSASQTQPSASPTQPSQDSLPVWPPASQQTSQQPKPSAGAGASSSMNGLAGTTPNSALSSQSSAKNIRAFNLQSPAGPTAGLHSVTSSPNPTNTVALARQAAELGMNTGPGQLFPIIPSNSAGQAVSAPPAGKAVQASFQQVSNVSSPNSNNHLTPAVSNGTASRVPVPVKVNGAQFPQPGSWPPAGLRTPTTTLAGAPAPTPASSNTLPPSTQTNEPVIRPFSLRTSRPKAASAQTNLPTILPATRNGVRSNRSAASGPANAVSSFNFSRSTRTPSSLQPRISPGQHTDELSRYEQQLEQQKQENRSIQQLLDSSSRATSYPPQWPYTPQPQR